MSFAYELMVLIHRYPGEFLILGEIIKNSIDISAHC